MIRYFLPTSHTRRNDGFPGESSCSRKPIYRRREGSEVVGAFHGFNGRSLNLKKDQGSAYPTPDSGPWSTATNYYTQRPLNFTYIRRARRHTGVFSRRGRVFRVSSVRSGLLKRPQTPEHPPQVRRKRELDVGAS